MRMKIHIGINSLQQRLGTAGLQYGVKVAPGLTEMFKTRIAQTENSVVQAADAETLVTIQIAD